MAKKQKPIFKAPKLKVLKPKRFKVSIPKVKISVKKWR